MSLTTYIFKPAPTPLSAYAYELLNIWEPPYETCSLLCLCREVVITTNGPTQRMILNSTNLSFRGSRFLWELGSEANDELLAVK